MNAAELAERDRKWEALQRKGPSGEPIAWTLDYDHIPNPDPANSDESNCILSSERTWLGDGAYGDVYKVVTKGTPVKPIYDTATRSWKMSTGTVLPRALKIVSLQSLMEKELEEPGGLDGVINECLLLADAGKHDNIVRLYDVYKSETEYALIMELMERDLFDAITSPQYNLTIEKIASVIRDCCSALSYMHRHGVAHRDVKPENIMLTPQIGTTPSVAKLADFGFAKTTTDSALTTTCGTPEYVAPEILIAGAARSQRDKMYGHECDIWSMGVVLYTMLTASNPFDGYNQIKTKRFPREYTNRVSGKTYKLDEAFGVDCVDLLDKMLKKDPKMRIDANGVLEHRWTVTHTSRLPLKQSDDQAMLSEVAKVARMNEVLQDSQTTLRDRFRLAVAKTMMEHKVVNHSAPKPAKRARVGCCFSKPK